MSESEKTTCENESTVDVSDISSNISGIEEVEVSFSEEETSRNTTSVLQRTCSIEKEPIQVFLRIRPLKPQETGVQYEINSNRTQLKVASSCTSSCKTNEFSFTNVFDGEVQQKSVFDIAIKPVLSDFVNGLSCLVFTYGVTNSGKTYTLQGIPADIGILPRALDVVFNSIPRHHKPVNPMPKYFNQFEDVSDEAIEEHNKLKRRLLSSCSKTVQGVLNETMINGVCDRDVSMFCPSVINGVGSCDTSLATPRASVLEDQFRMMDESSVSVESVGTDTAGFSVWVSFLEIYNEQITDLLVPISKYPTKASQLKLHEVGNGNVFVGGLKEIKVDSAQEACQILAAGQKNLKYSATSLNQRSSRSHCIFNIKLARVSSSGVKASLFSFCDLAGAERQAKANTAGSSLKEAANINTSMMQLGLCLKLLREKKVSSSSYVNFRNSKLTHLFQNVLQGSGKAVMIVNIAPCAHVFEETLNTLKFAAVAQKVSTNAVLANEMPKIISRSNAKGSLRKRKRLSMTTSKLRSSGLLQKASDIGTKGKNARKAGAKAKEKTIEESEVLEEEEKSENVGIVDEDDVSDESEKEEESEEENEESEESEGYTEEVTESDEEKWLPYPEYKRLAVDYLALRKWYKEQKQAWLDQKKESNAFFMKTITQKNQLYEDIESKKELIAELQKQLEAKEKELADAKHEMSLLDFDKTKAGDEREGQGQVWWRKEKEEYEKKLFESDEQCAELSHENEKLKVEIREQREKIEGFTAILERSEHKLKEVGEKLMADKEEHERQLKTLSDQLSGKTKQYEYMTDKCADYKKQKEDLLKQVESMSKNDSNSDELVAVRSFLAEIYTQMIEAVGDNDTDQAKPQDLGTLEIEGVLTEVQNAVNLLCEKLIETSEVDNEEIDKENINLSDVKKELRGLKPALTPQDLNVTLEMELVSRDLSALIELQPQTKRDKVQKILRGLNQSVERDQAVIAQANQIVRRSNVLTNARDKENTVNKERIALLKQQLGVAQQSIEDLTGQVESLKRELTGQKKQSEDMKRDISLLQQESLQSASRIESLQKQNEELVLSLTRANTGHSLNSKAGTLPATKVSKASSALNDSSIVPEIFSPTLNAIMALGTDHNSTRLPEVVPRKDNSDSEDGSEPPLKTQRSATGKRIGKRVAAMKKVFESSAKPPVQPPKRTTAKRSSRISKRKSGAGGRRVRTARAGTGGGLQKIPEDSVLEESELVADESRASFLEESLLPPKGKVSSGTCTTDSLDATKFELSQSSFVNSCSARVTRSAMKKGAGGVDSSFASAVSSESNSTSKPAKKRAKKPSRIAKNLFNPDPSDNLDMTVDDGDSQVAEMVNDILPAKKRRGRAAAKK